MMKPFFMTCDTEQDVTVSSQDMERQLDNYDPKACVLFSHSPSVQVYFALRNRLEKSSESWIHEFVFLDGLESLLDSLTHMVGPKFCGFSDAILQIDCLSCIRAVLNYGVGMEALVASQNGLKKLLRGVDLANTLPRKHVIEILSVVCVYSQPAYTKLLEAMDDHKRESHMYHRFSFIVNELKSAETVPHKTAVLTFINSIICCNTDRQARCRIRNEFIGLTLLDVLVFLQKEDTDEDLSIQLQAFHDKKHEDETFVDLNSSLDLSSPQDLTDAIQSRVFGKAKMVSFVNILQDLLAIETNNKQKSDVIWQLLERHIHHIVHAVDNISSLSGVGTESACQVIQHISNCNTTHTGHGNHLPCKTLPEPGGGEGVSQVTSDHEKENEKLRKEVIPDGPVDDLKNGVIRGGSNKRDAAVSLKTSGDSGYLACEDKFSPPPQSIDRELLSSSENASPVKTRDLGYMGFKGPRKEFVEVLDVKKDQKKGQLSMYNLSPDKQRQSPDVNSDTSYKYDVNKQITSLNNLNVNTNSARNPLLAISATTRILADTNLGFDMVGYTLHGQMASHLKGVGNLCMLLPPPKVPIQLCPKEVVFPTSRMKNLKWIKLDDSLVDLYPGSMWACNEIRRPKVQTEFGQVEEMFKETIDEDEQTETPLLSNQTRISLNLFLNRVEEEPTELVRRLIKLDGPDLSLPFIKHLVDILPEHEEVSQLKQFGGNLLELGQAEQFVLHLGDLPDYRTLLAGQLSRAQFAAAAPRLRSSLKVILDVSQSLLCSEGLKEVMSVILRIGNFLNHCQFNGHAGGFKLSSLARLSDVKSNICGQTLVHYLVSVVQAKDENMFAFLNEIPALDKAASTSPADIKDEFDNLNTKINAFVRQLAGANPIIRAGFDGFLEEVKSEFRELQGQITALKLQSQRLCEYFCETDGFDLQGCFKALLGFFKELRECRRELRLMKKTKDMATKQSNMFQKQHATRSKALEMGNDSRLLLVEEVIAELHRGNFSRPLFLDKMAQSLHLQDFLYSGHQVSNNAASDSDVMEDDETDAPPILPPRNIGVEQKDSNKGAREQSSSQTPDREVNRLNPMELSHISLVGTPMINRPRSEMFDEELTLAALDQQPRPVTSSVRDLGRVPPVLSMHHPFSRVAGQPRKTHHRSRSDLGESMTGATKWIRYHQHQQQQQTRYRKHHDSTEEAPLCRPESSMTLATLNLETGGPVGRRQATPYPYPGRRVANLVQGPVMTLPSRARDEDDDKLEEPQEFVRGGKRGERKSGTISNFFTKFSKKVLRQRSGNTLEKNVGSSGSGSGKVSKSARSSASGSEDGHGQENVESKKERIRDRTKSAGATFGRSVSGQGVGKRSRAEEKENINEDMNPFDRTKKNPIRVSNRFKGKLNK